MLSDNPLELRKPNCSVFFGSCQTSRDASMVNCDHAPRRNLDTDGRIPAAALSLP